MADRHALGAIGLLFGVATLAVMMIGTVVVGDHLTGRLQLEDAVQVVTLPVAGR